MSAVRPRPRKAKATNHALLNEVEAQFRKFVVLQSEHVYTAVSLWTAATHGQDLWDTFTRLCVVSPVSSRGKTRVMEIASRMSYKYIYTVNITPSAIPRCINPKDPPTLFIDEADTIFGTKQSAAIHEDLRGILNSGHSRDATYIRTTNTGKGVESRHRPWRRLRASATCRTRS